MSADIDQDFIEYIVKSLVSKPELVSIERTIDEKGVLLELTVDPEDLGRVIGKRGGTAQSMRTLLRALGTKNDARYNLKIVDSDGGLGQARPAVSGDAVDNTVADDSSQTTDLVDNKPVEDSPAVVVDNEASELSEKSRKGLDDLDDLDI